MPPKCQGVSSISFRLFHGSWNKKGSDSEVGGLARNQLPQHRMKKEDEGWGCHVTTHLCIPT